MAVCEQHHFIETTLARIEAKIDDLYKAIHIGNGSPSIRERLRTVEQALEQASIQAARSENRTLTALRIVGPFLLGLLAVYLGWK